MHKNKGSLHRQGWSLPEALVVLAVLGLLLGLAVPGMAHLRGRTELRAGAQDWWGSLMLARSQALQRQQRVALCPRTPADSCDPQGQWAQGWLVFVDANKNGTRDVAEPVLQTQGPWPRGMAARGNLADTDSIGYGPDGRSQSPSGAFQAGTLTVCRQGAPNGWNVVVNMLGRPRLEPVTAPLCD